MLLAPALMLAASVLAASVLAAGDSFPSGPLVGDKLAEFKLHAFSGGDAGKELKFLEKTKGGPTLLVFVHKITRPGLQFLRPVDKYAAENENLASHIVWITEDKDKTEEFLKRAQNSLNLQTNVGICLESKDGPPAYGLNDKVTLTVLVAKDNKVVANFALVDPNGKDARKVIEAMAKVLGKDPPKEEKEEKKERKGKDAKSPELQKLMRQLIQKDNTAEKVKTVIDAMKKWAGDDETKLVELREYASLVAGLGYGTEAALSELKKLAEKK